jgi:hypothetical protein
VSFYLFAGQPSDYVLKIRDKKNNRATGTEGSRARVPAGHAAMASLYRLLRDENETPEGGSFTPEDVAVLGTACEGILVALRLHDRDDPITEIIATKVIEIFRSGERDPTRISNRTIEELGIPDLDGGDK